jgi:hypothetical protein
MYEMEGPRRAPPHQGGQSPSQLALRAARQGQVPVRKAGFPVFPTCWSFLQMVPVSGGKAISTPSASTTQEFSADYFPFF